MNSNDREPSVEPRPLERRVRRVGSGKHSKKILYPHLGFNWRINDPISNFRKTFPWLDFITLSLENLDLIFKRHSFCLKFVNFIMQLKVYFIQFLIFRLKVEVFFLQIDYGFRRFPYYQLKYPIDMEDEPNAKVQPPAQEKPE